MGKPTHVKAEIYVVVGPDGSYNAVGGTWTKNESDLIDLALDGADASSPERIYKVTVDLEIPQIEDVAPSTVELLREDRE